MADFRCVVCIVYIFIFHSTRAENPLSPISHYAKIFTRHPKAQSTHSINIYVSSSSFSFLFLFIIVFFVAPCTEIKRDYNTNQQFVWSMSMYYVLYECVCMSVCQFILSFWGPPKLSLFVDLYSRKLVPLVLWV